MKEILFDEPTLIDKLTEYIFFSNLFEWTQAVHSNAIVRSAGIPSVERIDCNNFTQCTELLSCRLTCCTYIIQHELPSLSLHAPIASNCSKMKRNIRCFTYKSPGHQYAKQCMHACAYNTIAIE